MPKFFRKGDALFGFLKSGRNKNGEIVFRPVLGRVLALLLALGVAGWMSAALAVMIFVKEARDFDGGSYFDILFYPWRGEAYQAAWGDEYIERGMELLEQGDFQEGLHLVRVGHSKSPANIEGRMLLADFHNARGRPDVAAKLLREGLPYGRDDMDYLRTTFRLLIANQEDGKVQEIAEELLPDEAVVTPLNQITALAAATAQFHRGGYDQAEDLLVRYELTENPEGRILLARLDWERGRKQAALDRLQALSDQFTDQEEVYMLLTHYYRELGDHAKAHSYAVMRQINNPLAAAPRIALLHSHHQMGNDEKAERQADRLLSDFSNDRAALVQLGEFAANIGDVELSRRVFRAADKGGFPLDVPAILLAEAHLEADEFQEAIDFLEAHAERHENFEENHAPTVAGIYTVAYLGLGNQDDGEMHLRRFLNARNLRAETYLLTSRRMMEVTNREEADLARRVLVHAHRTDPQNQAALAELIRIDLEAGRTEDLVTNIPKLLTMRKPPRQLLQDSLSLLGGDEFLFLPERVELLELLREMIGDTGENTVSHS